MFFYKYSDLIEAEEYLRMFVYKLKMPNLLNALNDVANERVTAGKEYRKAFRNIEITFEEVKPLNQTNQCQHYQPS